MQIGQWLGKPKALRACIDTRSVIVEIPAGGGRIRDLARLKERLRAAIPGVCVSHVFTWDGTKTVTGSVGILVDDTQSAPEQVLSDHALLKACLRIVGEELIGDA